MILSKLLSLHMTNVKELEGFCWKSYSESNIKVKSNLSEVKEFESVNLEIS